MRILAFDTATQATTVAWLESESGKATEARDDPEAGQRPRHTQRLMSLIVAVLERAGRGWGDVDRLAVGVGPGTFTGLRVGVATARALARATGIPLVGVSTLQSLALAATDEADAGDHDAVLAVLGARRGEVFAAAWAPVGLGDARAARSLLEPLAIAPQRLREIAPTLGAYRLAVGDGAIEFRAVLECDGTGIPHDNSSLHLVTAKAVGRIAATTHPAASDDVRPQYLRLPDAELALRTGQKR